MGAHAGVMPKLGLNFSLQSSKTLHLCDVGPLGFGICCIWLGTLMRARPQCRGSSVGPMSDLTGTAVYKLVCLHHCAPCAGFITFFLIDF